MREMSQYQAAPIGPYNLTKLIGVGPVSRVFLAERQDQADQRVALKLFEAVPFDLLAEKDQALDEIRLLACLEHPSILPMLGDGLHEDRLYMVAPYIEGGSLRQRLTATAGELLPLKEIMALLRQVGEALQFAHTQGMVHANIKPENILVQDDGKVLLADFLLPSLVKSERAARILSTFAAFYMAPEQFQGVVTPLSDQYALACLAYELLTGQPPFDGDDFMSLARKHSTREPQLPSELQPKRVQHIDHVLLKALVKQPAGRYPDIRTFLAELSAPPPLVALSSPPETFPGVIQPQAAFPAPSLSISGAETEERPFQKAYPMSIGEFEQEPEPPTSWKAYPMSIGGFEQEPEQEPVSQVLLEVLPVAVIPDVHEVATIVIPAATPGPLPGAGRPVGLAPAPSQQAILQARTRAGSRLSPRRLWLTVGLVALAMLVSISGIALFFGASFTHTPPQSHVQATASTLSPTTSPGQSSPGVAATTIATPATTATSVLPTPTPTITRATPTAVLAASLSCQVNYNVPSQWSGGFIANLTITNTGNSAIQGWTLVFTFPGGQQITNGWNGHFTQNGAQVSISNANFNATLAPGASAPPGFQATSHTDNVKPTSFSLNGVACK